MAVHDGFAYPAVNYPPLDTGFVTVGTGLGYGAVNYSATYAPPNQICQFRSDFLTIGQSGNYTTVVSGGAGSVYEVRQSTVYNARVFMKSLATGEGLPGLAASLVITAAKNGAVSFSTITPTITDLGGGWYNLALTAPNTNTLGLMNFIITGPAAVPNPDLILDIVAFDKTDAMRFGLGALPNAAAGAATGLPLVGTQVPNATAGAVGGLPVQGGAIPNAAAGGGGGLPLVGTHVPGATVGTIGGLPVQGGAIPNFTAGINGGLPTVGAQIPNANAGSINGLALTSQVMNIAVTSAALNQIAASRALTFGTGSGGVANSYTPDAVYDTITANVSHQLDFYYQFELLSGGVGVGVKWLGYLVGSVNTGNVHVYNWVTAAWDRIGTVVGRGTTDNEEQNWELTSSHTGTGGSAGLVRIRFEGSILAGSDLKTDQILLGYVQAAPSVSMIVDAILDEMLTGHSNVGTVGDAIAISSCLLQGNFFMDEVDNTNPNGQTQARLRCFRSGIATQNATAGGTGEGEFATFIVDTTYTAPGKVDTHRSWRQ